MKWYEILLLVIGSVTIIGFAVYELVETQKKTNSQKIKEKMLELQKKDEEIKENIKKLSNK